MDELAPEQTPRTHPPGTTVVWGFSCLLAAALTLSSGLWLSTVLDDVMRTRQWSAQRQNGLNAGTLSGVAAALLLFAAWHGWRSRRRIGEVRTAVAAIAWWAFAGAAAFWIAAILHAVWDNREPMGEFTFAMFLTGPAAGAGLLAWAAAACGPPVHRRPLVQTAGWIVGCMLSALLTFGPAIWQTLRSGAVVGGVSSLIVAAGGLALVIVAALTAAIVWRRSEDAHDRLVRWGQIGFVGFAATGVGLAPFLARLFGESSRWDQEPAYFFTAFILLPALGCGAATLTARWTLRQVNV
ncbi:hypothetical protein LzC2_27280 [Planctomycetes bacterium LzC2]|uniref:Uncharacterized protein n=1 Tax=Alienimonas chondri TaxID=2681879 RepID=A0ABX1VEZ1_9PLAN|nr:hypothetical protein [Alienimonas chondri]